MSIMKNSESHFHRAAARFEQAALDLRARVATAASDTKAAWSRVHLDEIADQVRTARDELALQIHLAGMDAQDGLNRLEKRLETLRNEGELQLDHAAAELGAELEKLARALRDN